MTARERAVLSGFEAIDGAVRFHLTGMDGQVMQYAMTAEDAVRALAGLAHAAPDAWRQQADAWRMGDCRTCRNVRLVTAAGPGRHGNVHCPDCRPGPFADDYPAALPRV